jgi:hypothetical protein
LKVLVIDLEKVLVFEKAQVEYINQSLTRKGRSGGIIG